jgi:cysteinyl-tRNA synthetase
MSLRIYNTLTRREEPFLPADEKRGVTLYVCGPTVYDDPHIGHLRSAYVFEVIRRVLERSWKVTFVRNVTDVDDKIIDRAAADKLPIAAVTEKYLRAYHAALEKLGARPPDAEPRATESIADMQALVARLLERDAAYRAAGNVYFRVKRFAGYGELSRQKPDEMLENVRTEPGEGKEDPLDFALWKKSAPGEPSWDSPWGPGRPGWHLECSAMSTRRLGPTFDIHGGGRDLLFPHHENERAQSLAAGEGKFARVWMHHGLLTIEGRKMSKSLGNFVSLDDVLKKHSLDAVKLFFLQSHYRSDVDFTWAKMAALEEAVRSFYLFFEKAPAAGPLAPRDREAASAHYLELREALEADFNTPGAVAVLFTVLRKGNEALAKGDLAGAAARARWLADAAELFGLFGPAHARAAGDGAWRRALEELLRFRDEKRLAKRYDISDFIRAELVAMGFEAEDQKGGSHVMRLRAGGEDPALEERLKKLLDDARRRAEKA